MPFRLSEEGQKNPLKGLLDGIWFYPAIIPNTLMFNQLQSIEIAL